MLNNTETELKKSFAYKKTCILLVPLIIPLLAVRVKVYLTYFLFRREFEVVFAWIVKKIAFLV